MDDIIFTPPIDPARMDAVESALKKLSATQAEHLARLEKVETDFLTLKKQTKE